VNINQAIKIASKQLNNEEEVKTLITFALKTHYKNYYKLDQNKRIPYSFFKLLKKRVKGVPIQYITKSTPFFEFDIRVGKGVLIPRFETETLADVALQHIKKGEIQTVYDFGTGSGAVSKVLANRFPNIKVFSVEKSKKAIKYAKKNLKGYKNVQIIHSLVEKLPLTVLPKADLIVANPPYVPLIQKLPAEVKNYEPHTALYGDIFNADGLDITKIFIEIGIKILNKNGVILVEHGDGQDKLLKTFSKKTNWEVINEYTDLSGKNRVSKIVKNTFFQSQH
jgi:release factor glutamine methyltransferase